MVDSIPDKIYPCPVCGASFERGILVTTKQNPGYIDTTQYAMGCGCCCMRTGGSATVEDAIEEWNCMSIRHERTVKRLKATLARVKKSKA